MRQRANTPSRRRQMIERERSHLEKAEALLKDSVRSQPHGVGDILLRRAQVHATLALYYQREGEREPV